MEGKEKETVFKNEQPFAGIEGEWNKYLFEPAAMLLPVAMTLLFVHLFGTQGPCYTHRP